MGFDATSGVNRLRLTAALVVCLMAVVALHHLGGHGAAPGHTCELCVLLSTALAALPVLYLLPPAMPPRRTPAVRRVAVARRDIFSVLSHRGPPSSS